jgi:hypothetical protein
MRPIAIVPRPGHENRAELRDAMACLLKAGINACSATMGQDFALVWIDDENILNSIETLRIAGLQATVLTENDVPH